MRSSTRKAPSEYACFSVENPLPAHDSSHVRLGSTRACQMSRSAKSFKQSTQTSQTFKQSRNPSQTSETERRAGLPGSALSNVGALDALCTKALASPVPPRRCPNPEIMKKHENPDALVNTSTAHSSCGKHMVQGCFGFTTSLHIPA